MKCGPLENSAVSFKWNEWSPMCIVCVCISVCIYIYVCVCVCVRACVRVCIYVYSSHKSKKYKVLLQGYSAKKIKLKDNARPCFKLIIHILFKCWLTDWLMIYIGILLCTFIRVNWWPKSKHLIYKLACTHTLIRWAKLRLNKLRHTYNTIIHVCKIEIAEFIYQLAHRIPTMKRNNFNKNRIPTHI